MTGNFNVIESIINFRHGCGTLFIEPTRVVGLGLVETDSRSSSDLEDSRLPTVINCLENFRTALINNGIQWRTSHMTGADANHLFHSE